MAITVSKDEFIRMDESAVRTYINDVYELYLQKKKGCSDCGSRNLDMKLSGVVAFSGWSQSSPFSQEGDFNVMSTGDIISVYDNINSI